MTYHSVHCEAVDVRTDTGICPGMAKTQKGETYIINARTPETKGICTNALSAFLPMLHMLRITDKMEWEKEDFLDMVCPHGYVTFRLSRDKNEADS